MKKKIDMRIVFFVFAAILFAAAYFAYNLSLAVSAAPAGGEGLAIYSGSEKAASVLLETNEKQKLTAGGVSGSADYVWQILDMETNTWVDVQGSNGTSFTLSYAVVKNMIGDDAKTAVRCTAAQNGSMHYSDPVFVTVNLSSEQEPSDVVTVAPAPEQEATKSTAAPRKSAAAPAAQSDSGIVTITIHYQLEDGTPVFGDYVASLQDGSAFSAEVSSPLYIGYEPKISEGGVYKDAKTVALQYTNLHTNVELTVVYRPAQSPYTVRYLLQNVLNDRYTEDTSLKKTGTALTGTYPVDDIEREIPGFTALFHEPDVVAADGSTEFECYYDRNYYLYNFDCNGGYGADPVYARYGAALVVREPERTGYTFAGWDLMEENGEYDGVADTVDTTVGIGNKTYRAIWNAEEANFTVVYWAENANDSGFSYITSYTYETTSGMRIRDTDFDNFKLSSDKNNGTYPYYEDADYFEYDAERTERNNDFADGFGATDGKPIKYIAVEGDGSTTLNVVYQRKEYTLKFFYAKSENKDGEEKYYVVGGSTYHFGWAGSTASNLEGTTNEQEMLENMNDHSDQWGEVTALPTLNERGKERPYTTGSETYSGVTYYYLSFTEKYGSDISDLWPVSVFEPVTRSKPNENPKHEWTGIEAYRSAWNGENHIKYTQDALKISYQNGNQTIKGIYQKLDRTLLYDEAYEDSDTLRFLCFWENGADITWSIPKLFIYELYVPVMEGEQADITYNGVEYRFYVEPINTYDNTSLTNDPYYNQQTASALEGFTYLDRKGTQNQKLDNGMESHTVQFFYTRNSHTLTFSSQNDPVYSVEVPFETALKTYSTVDEIKNPKYPASLEPGAYEFGGWYLAPDGQGTEIDIENTTMTMPDSDLTLYAYWKPVEHTVTFSDTYEDMEVGKYSKSVTVAHNDRVDSSDVPIPSPEDLGTGSYEFKGWFYINDRGEKQAFSAADMLVTEDMHLFAEWQSTSVISYTIHYQDENGTAIGTDTTGYSYAGATKTFTAKAGEELSEGYRTGYYPETNSHSMLMNGDGTGNEYTFVYVKKESVNYTVRYIEQSTGKVLAEEKKETTQDAVVTEQFLQISGYIPDGFYKRLVLSANDEENVITFYYTKDTEHAIYAVRHMVEELDGAWSEYAYIEGVGNLNETVEAPAMAIEGFTYDVSKTNSAQKNEKNTVTEKGVSGQVTADGLEMELYYVRNKYNYTIQYVEYGTTSVLETPVSNGEGKYGERITHTPPEELKPEDGDGAVYQLINPENTPRVFTLREDNEIFTVYYRIQMHTINYIAVSNYPGAADFGTVSPLSEQVERLSGIKGSVPEPGEFYRFEGWYTDAACTTPVEDAWVEKSTDKLTPQDISGEVSSYYALFVPQLGDLEITKTGVAPEDGNQTFLFQITGRNRDDLTSNINLTVSITGNGSVTVTDLPVGSYTVTEISGWSWRYECGATPNPQIVTVKENENNTVTFTNESKNTTWLGGEGSKSNRFASVTEP